MPFKANADRRHHIPTQRHRVKNGSEYDAGLRARGSLIVWFTVKATEAWRAAPRTTRGGQLCYLYQIPLIRTDTPNRAVRWT